MVLTRGQTSMTKGLRLEAHQANERFLNLEGRGKELLPGIPNEITLERVTPKLSWTDFCVLSLTSPFWRDAIRSRHVHDARVQSHSTETLILVQRLTEDQPFPTMALFSMRDGFFAEFPPLPHLRRPGIPCYCESVSLDGKIYVLGGDLTIGEDYPFNTSNRVEDYRFNTSNRVYVLDLAGHRQWRECARMRQARQDFGCSVLGGKIYVFGGCSSRAKAYDQAEVYDPTENTWSPITSTIPLPRFETVATLGEEILLLNSGSPGPWCPITSQPLCAKYHPAKDEWTVLTSFPKKPQNSSVFTAQGKLHALSSHHIHVLDMEGNSWRQLQSCSLVEIGIVFPEMCAFHFAPLAVDDEILAILSYFDDHVGGACLVRSRGFRSEVEEIMWQEYAKFDIPVPRFMDDSSWLMETVQL